MTRKERSNVIRETADAPDSAKEVLKFADRKLRRTGQELQDGIEQELTGLGLLAENLADELREISSDQTELAARVAKGISLANNRAHSLARGLIPVPATTDGLMAALSELAEATARSIRSLLCTFVCPQAVSVADNMVGTQLYRIAQEAVTNAVKHAEASHISIGLGRPDGAIRLEVQDDGDSSAARFVPEQKSRLRIMRYRSELIRGDLQIGRSAMGGTAVICVAPP